MVRRVRYLSIDDVSIILRGLRISYPNDYIRVMNRGVIESVLQAVRYAGRDLTSFRGRLAAKAATLLYLIVVGHPLTDGNKRFAHLVTLEFLKINGYTVSSALLRDLTLNAASLQIRPDDIYKLLYAHIVRVG